MFLNEIFGSKKYDKDKRGSSSQLPADQRTRRASGEEGDEEGVEEDGIIFAEYISGVVFRILQVCVVVGVILISREISFYVFDKTGDGGAALLSSLGFMGASAYVFLPRLREKRGGRRV